jgi:hypothetical protein
VRGLNQFKSKISKRHERITTRNKPVDPIEQEINKELEERKLLRMMSSTLNSSFRGQSTAYSPTKTLNSGNTVPKFESALKMRKKSLDLSNGKRTPNSKNCPKFLPQFRGHSSHYQPDESTKFSNRERHAIEEFKEKQK